MDSKTLFSPDMALLLSQLPEGQRRAAAALIGQVRAVTYEQAAALAGMSRGTLHEHLARIRRQRPEVYAAVMAVRRAQLAVRHKTAELRAGEHSAGWARRKSRFMYHVLHGHPAPAWWPPR